MRIHQKLFSACAKGKTAEAKRLIAEGALVDWQNEYGGTSLHVTSYYGMTEIVMLLLQNKCNINVTTKKGDTPLIWAARFGKMDIVRILVKALCDITACGYQNKTAVEWARKEGHPAIAEYLANEAPRVQVHSTHCARAAP